MDVDKPGSLQIWKGGAFSEHVFFEIQENLHKKEMEFIGKDTQDLVARNTALGGSQHGFFYKGELFVVNGAFGKKGIDALHISLEEDAEYLRLNRVEIQQHLTYIAHFLGALERFSGTNPSTYCANAPGGLVQLSATFTQLDKYCQQNDTDFYKEAPFDREDKSKASFFAHHDRIDGPINRFLFRRIVK